MVYVFNHMQRNFYHTVAFINVMCACMYATNDTIILYSLAEKIHYTIYKVDRIFRWMNEKAYQNLLNIIQKKSEIWEGQNWDSIWKEQASNLTLNEWMKYFVG